MVGIPPEQATMRTSPTELFRLVVLSLFKGRVVEVMSAGIGSGPRL
jgi:hypothetical protein